MSRQVLIMKMKKRMKTKPVLDFAQSLVRLKVISKADRSSIVLCLIMPMDVSEAVETMLMSGDV